MKMMIDPRGGISGDMFSAALISAGADSGIMQNVMLNASSRLGKGNISTNLASDGSTQLNIQLQPSHPHLKGKDARSLLLELCDRFAVQQEYRHFGFRILDNLLKAEKRAHRDQRFKHLKELHTHDSRAANEETFLHEAQDIIIDIAGAMMGLQNLKLRPCAILLYPVSVGGGFVDFSHGRLPVPAPATEIILNSQNIPWQTGPIEVELCTPTGAAILAGLQIKKEIKQSDRNRTILGSGCSRGSQFYPISPLTIYLVED
jgi:uncharacterized protein (DUF111 family)